MMNKDEAVMKLSKAAGLSMAHAEDLYDSFFEKPVVPQYVADWYEKHKDKFEINLFRFIYIASDTYPDDNLGKFENWLIADANDTLQTLVNMHQFGYEVEKEPRYTVRVKGVSKDTSFLKRSDKGIWCFGRNDIQLGILPHTRKELENANFGWVFDCPGMEVKEVE